MKSVGNKKTTIMGQRLKRAKVERLGACSYRIESSGIDAGGEEEKRRGFILETDGEALIIPFKKSDPRKRHAHGIRDSAHGSLKLSPARQKVTVTITLDREKDSEDAFLAEFKELTEGYVLDLLKYEIDECLE